MSKSNKETVSILKGSNIAAGGGYSTDSQQVAPQICYSTIASPFSGQSASLGLDTSQSFMDIQNEAKLSVTTEGGIGMFSADAEASYLQSMEDKDYSMSLNYHYTTYATVSMQLAGFGVDALTESGKSFYNNGNNTYFGLTCGDHYISSYNEGAMLLMGINIQFSSHYEKEQFTASAGTEFGNIFSACGEIEQTASAYGMSGSVTMQAYQMGGDPSQLSYILNKDSNGDYYVLTCNLNNMNDCTKAASGMLDYAKYNFSTQISYENNTGLTSLGTGFMEHQPINYIGLTPPISLVIPQVENNREKLADLLIEYQHYEQKFYELIEGYPVNWDITSDIYKTSESLYQIAQKNIALLMSPSNPQAGALGCYSYPNQCEDITQSILEDIVPITAENLIYLEPIKYYYDTPCSCIGSYIYRNGDNENSWAPYSPAGAKDSVSDYKYFIVTSPTSYTANYCLTNTPHWYLTNGTSTDDGLTYTGTYLDVTEDKYWGDGLASRHDSPFYFSAYNEADQASEITGAASIQDAVHA